MPYILEVLKLGKKTWTEEQEQYLRENYGKMELSEIGRYLDKTTYAVDAKLRRMGVPRMKLGERMHLLALEGKHPMQKPEVIKNFIGNLNPSCRPEVKEKISQIRKAEYANGTNKCGWRGPQRVPTKAEQSIMGGMTRMGFEWNKPIKTGNTWHYSLDFSNKQLKICVEIDGSSHKGDLRQERDRRKDGFLKTNGWTILRFTNEQVLSRPIEIISIVKTTLKDLNSFGEGKVAEEKVRISHN